MLALCCEAHASQTGQTYFAHGAQTIYSALLPPPGQAQFYGYFLFYEAGSVRDADGRKTEGVEAQAMAMAPRVVYTWKQGLWGFKLSSGVFATMMSAGVKTPAGEDFDTGPFNFGFEPLYFTRSFGNWHVLLGTSIFCPWGSYDPESPVNSTLNRYGGSINGNLTWTPTPRWDVTLSWGYEFAGRNRDTQYRDGAQTGITYGVGYRLGAERRWDVGISGFYTAQVEDDRQSGHVVDDHRTRKFAIGPKLGYWVTPAAGVFFQVQKEYETRNAPQGEYYWLMFAFPLNGV